MMRLKKLLLTLMSITVLMSCGVTGSEELQKEVISTYEDGSPSKATFVDGKGQLVKEERYHENGKLKIIGHYKDGQRHGEWNAFYEDGTKWSENIYKEGKNDGPYATYWPNGEKYVTGQYKDGAEVGNWKFYAEDGTVSKEVNY